MNKELFNLEYKKFIKSKIIFFLFFILIVITIAILLISSFNNKELTLNEYKYEIHSLERALDSLPKTGVTEELRKSLLDDINKKVIQMKAFENEEWKKVLELQIELDRKLLENVSTGKAVSTISNDELNERIIINNEFINRNIKPKNFENSGFYILYQFLDSIYGLFGVVVILIISGGILTKDFENGSIRFLLVQPIPRSSILNTKFSFSVLNSFIILLFLMVYTFILGSIIYGIGSGNYPFLIQDLDNSYFINITELIFKSTILFILVIIFSIVLNFFFSVIFKNTLAALSATLILLLLSSTAFNKVESLQKIAHLVPVSYLDTFGIVNGDLSYTLGNSNITFFNGIIILLTFSLVLYFISRRIYKKTILL